MQAEPQIAPNGSSLDRPPSPRPSSATRPATDMADDANKRYKVMAIIDRSEVENLPVTEEALDLEAMDAVATEQKQDAEISYLRQNDSYEVWSNADRVEYMKEHPNAKLLTVRWVVTEKARLVVREYNTWRTQEFFAATGNPMAQRVIPTIAVKRGYNTMVLDAVRAYLQVPEDDDVFIIPPAQWRRHDDFKAHSCWKAKTVWYGERHAAQAFQDFWQAIFVRWAVFVGSVTPRNLSSWNVVSTWKRTWTMRTARDQTHRWSGFMRRFCRGGSSSSP